MSKISKYYATRATAEEPEGSNVLTILSPKLGNPSYAEKITYQILGLDGFYKGTPLYLEEAITKTGTLYVLGQNPTVTVSHTGPKTFSDERQGVRAILEFGKAADNIETATLTYSWPNRDPETRIFFEVSDPSVLGLSN